MRIVMLSDTHGLHNQVDVPEGDVLIHAGDWTMDGSWARLQAATEWFNSLPHKHKLAIGGNHDWCLQHFMVSGREDLVRDFFAPTVYLRDSGVTIDGVKFWGSPWQPEFCGWAFNLERGKQLKEKWDLIPRDTDVLITHSPPAGVMDTCRPFPPHYLRTKGGCDYLLEAVARVKPKLNVFGHIHGGYGSNHNGFTQFFNASVVNERYKVVNKPWVYDL